MLYVLRDFPGRLVHARMAVAQNVGLESEKLLHRLPPAFMIAIELVKQRSAEVLTKEYPFSVKIDIKRNGAWRVARGMDEADVLIRGRDAPFISR